VFFYVQKFERSLFVILPFLSPRKGSAAPVSRRRLCFTRSFAEHKG